MSNKITFKQYLESKENLREAIKSTPQKTAIYKVQKYCKLIVGEDYSEKQYIPLKPTQKIIVEWLYEDINDPTILNIKFINNEKIDSNEEFKTFWKGTKLLKWLTRNTKEESSL